MTNYCEVCGKEIKGTPYVCASRYGAVSNMYCEDCLQAGLEPYGNYVALFFINNWTKEACEEDYIKQSKSFQDAYNSLQAVLEIRGITLDEFFVDVEAAMNYEYDADDDFEDAVMDSDMYGEFTCDYYESDFDKEGN